MQFTGCFQKIYFGWNKNWIPGSGWMVECSAPGKSTLKTDGPELPNKSPCSTELPPALAIPWHSCFAVTSYFPGEAGCDHLYPTNSPKQAVYKKSLGTDLCYRVTTKVLDRGNTDCAPHVAHSIFQAYLSKSPHMSFPSWINCHRSSFKAVHYFMITTKYVRGILANNCPANKLLNCFAWQLSQVTKQKAELCTTRQTGTAPRPDFCRSILTDQPLHCNCYCPPRE